MLSLISLFFFPCRAPRPTTAEHRLNVLRTDFEVRGSGWLTADRSDARRVILIPLENLIVKRDFASREERNVIFSR